MRSSVEVTESSPDAPTLPEDPNALIRSRPYRALLVIAALVGLVVSTAAWCFLEIVHLLQIWVFNDLPGELGFSSQPVWWPLPWLALAGAVTAIDAHARPASRPRLNGWTQN